MSAESEYLEELGLKLPPHSLEAEQSVLGGLMIDARMIDDVADLIAPEDFYRPSHQRIFQTLTALQAEGTGIDVVTLAERLASRGELDEVGGSVYLAEIAASTPSTANIVAYANAVRVKAQERALVAAGNLVADLGFDTTGMTIDEKIAGAQQAVMAIGECKEEMRLLESNHALTAWVEQVDRRFNGEATLGLMTGFADIDRRTNGLQPQDLVLIAARPSMGKTAFAMNIAKHVAIDNRGPVLVFSMEMSGMGLWERMGSSLANIPLDRLRRGQLMPEDWKRLNAGVGRAKNAPLYIDERAALGIHQIQATARRLHRKTPLSLIVVDYLQLATARADNREREVSKVSAGLKALAKELNIPVIALSQLNRDLEKRNDKRPINADLRDSGSLEQDADQIFFLYRDEYYNAKTNSPGVAEIICSKFRNGRTGTDYLASRLEYSRFENLEGTHSPTEDLASKSRPGLDY